MLNPRFKINHYISLLLAAVLFCSCSKQHTEVKRSVYYWKTDFKLTEFEKSYLSRLQIKKMYIRLFDVSFDKTKNEIIPVGKINFTDAVPQDIEVVPVVFITNNSVKNIGSLEAEEAAVKIVRQVNYICHNNSLAFNELQLDCDWSESTEQAYFNLIKEIKKQFNNQKIISATIRLHQIKYYQKTGIPPADRGMLMFYNMGDADQYPVNNSIYNNEDASLYTSYIKEYPLKLDAALPIYSHVLQYRDGHLINILNRTFTADLNDPKNFSTTNNGFYKAEDSFFLHGIYFMKDDIIKVEYLTGPKLVEASETLSENITKDDRSIILFDLDSLNLRRYNEKELQKTFNNFN